MHYYIIAIFSPIPCSSPFIQSVLNAGKIAAAERNRSNFIFIATKKKSMLINNIYTISRNFSQLPIIGTFGF